MANLLNGVNDVKDNLKKKYDDLSTFVYKSARKSKEYVDNSFNGKFKSDEKRKQEATYDDQMYSQFLGSENIEDTYQIDSDGLQYDSSRAQFSSINKDEYNDPTRIEKSSEIIEAYLTGSDGKNFLDADDKKKKKNVEYDDMRLRAAQKFKENFDKNKVFGFEEKNKMLAGSSNISSKTAIDRYGLLNRVVCGFAGDKDALEKIDEEPNQTLANNFTNIVQSFLKGDVDEKTTGNNLFMQIHGIDHTKMPENMPLEKIVALCALSENHQNAQDFTEYSVNTLNKLNKAILNGNTDLRKLALEEHIMETVGKTRGDKALDGPNKGGDQMLDLQKTRNGATGALLFENNDSLVDITHFSEGTPISLVAKVDKDDKFVAGSIENVMNALLSEDINTREALESDRGSELTNIIENFREAQGREAAERPMTDAERAAYNAELLAADEEHRRRVNNYAG